MLRSIILGLMAAAVLFTVAGCGSAKASPEEVQHFDDNRKREQAEDAANASR